MYIHSRDTVPQHLIPILVSEYGKSHNGMTMVTMTKNTLKIIIIKKYYTLSDMYPEGSDWENLKH